jgi:hypothetical protein
MRIARRVLIAEVKMAAWVASEGIRFRKANTLTPLVRKIFPDSKITNGVKVKHTKAIEIIKSVFGPYGLEELAEELKNSPFSIIVDETTNRCIKKSLSIMVCYKNCSDDVKEEFLGLLEVKDHPRDRKSLLTSI